MFRNYILRIHIYIGLFCLPYLLIFSLSSLNFNHHFLPEKLSEEQSASWQVKVNLPETYDNAALANMVKDSLGLFGWAPWWEYRRDSVSFRFGVTHTGKFYEVVTRKGSGVVTVNQWNYQSGNVLKGLHFLGEKIPGAPLHINMWRFYQDLTVYAVFFWVLSGLYMWILKRRKGGLESPVLLAISIFSVALIITVWLVK